VKFPHDLLNFTQVTGMATVQSGATLTLNGVGKVNGTVMAEATATVQFAGSPRRRFGC
jgi:hypothetical protein